MATHVLFMCPHSAGKSLAAATYFRAATARRGIDVEISVAGPDPDEVNMPTVAGSLSAQGYRIDWNPKLVSATDLGEADIAVSIGCDAASLPTDRQLIEWDVPLPSQDLSGSLQAIHERVEQLAHELAGR